MADYTTYDNGDPIARSAGSNAASFPMRTTFEVLFDGTRRNMTENEDVEVMDIPPNTVVESVFYEVVQAEDTGTPTLNIGDDDAGTRFFTGAAMTAGGKGYAALTADNWHADGNKVVLTVPAGKDVTTLKLRVVLAVTSFG